jgi:hypothetical protein
VENVFMPVLPVKISAKRRAERCALPMQIGRHVYFKTQFIGGKYEPVKLTYFGREP